MVNAVVLCSDKIQGWESIMAKKPGIHGRFLWQDLLAEDMAAAAEFYPQVLAWSAQSAAPGRDYQMFNAAHGPVSGYMPLPVEARQVGARPHWLPYIGADDVDATTAAALEHGGKIQRPPDTIPGVCRFAVLADPQGASFAVVTPTGMPVPDASQVRPGDMSWQELTAVDTEAALELYRELFGWQVVRRTDMGLMGTYTVFGRDGVQVGGLYRLPPNLQQPFWLSYVAVTDADAAANAARKAGGQVVQAPVDVPGGGRVAQLLDRTGILFAVHAAASANAQAPTAQAAPQPKAKPKAKAKPKPKAKLKSKPKAKANVVAKPRTKVKAKAKGRITLRAANRKGKSKAGAKPKPARARARPRRKK